MALASPLLLLHRIFRLFPSFPIYNSVQLKQHIHTHVCVFVCAKYRLVFVFVSVQFFPSPRLSTYDEFHFISSELQAFMMDNCKCMAAQK